MKFIKFVFRKIGKIRYKTILLIVKHFTPILYKEIEPIIKRSENWCKTPRPSIKVMKRFFNNKFVKGAEIGVDKGINAKSILNELNVKKLYLIDPWINYKEIRVNRPNILNNYKLVSKLFKNDKRIKIIKDFSLNAVKNLKDNSLDFVYIDGNHSYKYVFQDINLWTPKVKKGGFISGHDIILNKGVSKAVKEFCFKRNINFIIDVPDWYFIK